MAPLLIASFAFNFNNFNVDPADDRRRRRSRRTTSQRGGTDLLVSYTYRLAFADGGAQYGFAAAISVLIFVIVAVFSIIGFRRTAALEEINR